jgi:hypothetical protein
MWPQKFYKIVPTPFLAFGENDFGLSFLELATLRSNTQGAYSPMILRKTYDEIYYIYLSFKTSKFNVLVVSWQVSQPLKSS